ncbi:hypothetical protein D3C76_866250 [compost metagenome]
MLLQQPVGQVHHGHVHAALLEAVGRFQSEQAATYDHCVAVGARGLDHGAGAGDIAVADHALQAVAGNRQAAGGRASGDHQAVVVGTGAVFGDDLATLAVDLHHLAIEQQFDAVAFVPGEIVEDDLLEGLLARQHRREQGAVVIRMGLGAEHLDLVMVGRQSQQLFEGTHSGHAVTDHHQLGFLHARTLLHIHVEQTKKASRCCQQDAFVQVPFDRESAVSSLRRALLYCRDLCCRCRANRSKPCISRPGTVTCGSPRTRAGRLAPSWCVSRAATGPAGPD